MSFSGYNYLTIKLNQTYDELGIDFTANIGSKKQIDLY